MKQVLISLTLLIGFFLSGCSVGPDFQKPQIDTLRTFRFDSLKTDTTVNVEWWNLFKDPKIRWLVNTALLNNKNLKIAAARIEQAGAMLTYTGADRYPSLNYQATAGRGNYASGTKLQSEANIFTIMPTLNWEIDFWGKYRRATEAAQAELLASEYGYRSVELNLVSLVISTYFLLLDFQNRLEITKATLDSRRKSYEIIKKRFEHGVVPEIDLNQAQIQMEIAAAGVPFLERAVAKTENALSVLLGQNPGEIEIGLNLTGQEIPPEIPVGIPSEILRRRPDVLQAENMLKAQNAKIGVAVAQMYPSFGLTGLFGAASGDLSTLLSSDPAWLVAGSITGPIFNFNKNTARVEIEKARTKEALLNYQQTVLNAFRDVEDALVEINTFKRELAAKQRQADAARNAVELSRMRYDQGVTSYLEVLESERTLFNSELELSGTLRNYLSAYVKLYKALGGGWKEK
jgi:multidrug efflux system outer membrane protein